MTTEIDVVRGMVVTVDDLRCPYANTSKRLKLQLCPCVKRKGKKTKCEQMDGFTVRLNSALHFKLPVYSFLLHSSTAIGFFLSLLPFLSEIDW